MVSFRTIKEAVSIEAVLKHYGIFETLAERGKSYRGVCPFCESTDNNPFSVSLEKNCFNAFCCGKHGNVLDFVAGMEDISVKEAAEHLNNLFGVEKKPAQKKGNRGKQEKEELQETPGGNSPLEFTLDGIEPAHHVVNALGISEETARTFGAGFFSGRGMFKNHFVMPIYSFDGDLIAYTGVTREDPITPVYPKQFNRGIELFGKYQLSDRDHASKKPLIVVRNPLEVLSLADLGREAVALMGEGITQEQVRLLNRCCGTSRKLILFMAQEDPGAVSALNGILPYFYVRMIRFQRDPDKPYTYDDETLELLEI